MVSNVLRGSGVSFGQALMGGSRTMGFEMRDSLHYRRRKQRAGAIAIGLLMLSLGLVAMIHPLFRPLEATRLFGWLFMSGTGLLLFYALQSRESGQFSLKLLISAIHLLTGSLLLVNPLEGIPTLTLVGGIAIFVQGVVQTILAFQIRPVPNWSWVLLSGTVSSMIGILLWSRSPFSANSTAGLLIGSTFLLEGLWIVMLAVAVHPAPR